MDREGGAVLALGDQAPLMFEAAGLLFPVALLGLHDRLGGEGGRRARVGGVLARVAAGSGLMAVAYGVLVPSPSGVFLGLLIAVTGFSTFVGLLLLGLAARSVGTLPFAWRNLPAAMGIAAIPAVTVIGGLLEAIHERLLELPIVAFGVAWVLLGFLLWSHQRRCRAMDPDASPVIEGCARRMRFGAPAGRGRASTDGTAAEWGH